MVLTTIKGFLMALLSHCSKNSANRLGQPHYKRGHHFQCAIPLGQGASCSCCERGILFVVSGDRRLDRCTARRVRAKLFPYANSHGFTDAGFRSDSQRDSYPDAQGSDADRSESDTDPNSNSYHYANPDAFGLSRSECHTDAHADASVLVAVFTSLHLKNTFCVLKRVKIFTAQKQNPPAFADGFWLSI
jgi:hypothetical protein